MKVLLVHNRYRLAGGEDEVFLRESRLLRLAGHEVTEYIRSNSEIVENGILNQVSLGMRTLWARDSQEALRSILRRERPHIVHFHNTFPLISPAAYYACLNERIPVVQSLHNARLLCPAATLWREGKLCEDCLGKTLPWPGVVHSCYHNSSLRSTAVAGMIALHRLLGTWQKTIDAYIVFNEFYRRKFISTGLPPEKLFLKPHFIDTDPGMKHDTGTYALFVGRLVREKGILTVLDAWHALDHVPLTIAGEGALSNEVRRFAKAKPLVRVFPHLSASECLHLIKEARFLIWPSNCLESFGLVAIEAFACGTPIIASALGGMQEIVEDKKTGLLFEANNPKDLAEKVAWAWSNREQLKTMGNSAREEYKVKYTAERNYSILMQIYEQARKASNRKDYSETQVLQ